MAGFPAYVNDGGDIRSESDRLKKAERHVQALAALGFGKRDNLTFNLSPKDAVKVRPDLLELAKIYGKDPSDLIGIYRAHHELSERIYNYLERDLVRIGRQSAEEALRKRRKALNILTKIYAAAPGREARIHLGLFLALTTNIPLAEIEPFRSHPAYAGLQQGIKEEKLRNTYLKLTKNVVFVPRWLKNPVTLADTKSATVRFALSYLQASSVREALTKLYLKERILLFLPHRCDVMDAWTAVDLDENNRRQKLFKDAIARLTKSNQALAQLVESFSNKKTARWDRAKPLLVYAGHVLSKRDPDINTRQRMKKAADRLAKRAHQYAHRVSIGVQRINDLLTMAALIAAFTPIGLGVGLIAGIFGIGKGILEFAVAVDEKGAREALRLWPTADRYIEIAEQPGSYADEAALLVIEILFFVTPFRDSIKKVGNLGKAREIATEKAALANKQSNLTHELDNVHSNTFQQKQSLKTNRKHLEKLEDRLTETRKNVHFRNEYARQKSIFSSQLRQLKQRHADIAKRIDADNALLEQVDSLAIGVLDYRRLILKRRVKNQRKTLERLSKKLERIARNPELTATQAQRDAKKALLSFENRARKTLSQLKKAKADVKYAHSKREILSKRVDDHVHRLQDVESQISVLVTKHYEANARNIQLLRDLLKAKERIKSLRNQVALASQRQDALTQQLSQIQRQVKKLELEKSANEKMFGVFEGLLLDAIEKRSARIAAYAEVYRDFAATFPGAGTRAIAGEGTKRTQGELASEVFGQKSSTSEAARDSFVEANESLGRKAASVTRGVSGVINVGTKLLRRGTEEIQKATMYKSESK